MKNVLTTLGIFAAGICVGLLVAPGKGSETRKRIANTVGDWTDKIKEIFQNADEEAENIKHKTKRVKSAVKH